MVVGSRNTGFQIAKELSATPLGSPCDQDIRQTPLPGQLDAISSGG